MLTASGAGSEALTALQATLERDEALAAFAALDGSPSGVTVSAAVTYRDAPTQVRVRLQGRWSDVHDALADGAADDGALRPLQIESAIDEVLAGVRVRWTATDAASGKPLPAAEGRQHAHAVLGGALGYLIDRSHDSSNVANGAGATVRLRARPPEAMSLELDQRITAYRIGAIELSSPLETILNRALGDGPPDQFVRLLGPTAGADGFAPNAAGRGAHARRDASDRAGHVERPPETGPFRWSRSMAAFEASPGP